MASDERSHRFERDWRSLTIDQRARFRTAFRRFDADLNDGRFRAGLRVRHVEGTDAVLEVTWAPDVRATFEYGQSEGDGAVIIWRRIGTHENFRRP